MKGADNLGVAEALERAYCYKLSSIIFYPQTLPQALENLTSRMAIDNLSGRAKSLVNLLSKVCEDERIRVLSETYGEMRKYEPLERKLVPGPVIGVTLADISAFYNAFGLRIRGDVLIDHLSTELEFMAHMELKRAYAIANDNREMLDIVTKAEDSFLRDHLSRTAVFVIALKNSGDSVLEEIAGLVSSFLNEEFGRRNLGKLGSVIKLFEGEKDAVRCPFA